MDFKTELEELLRRYVPNTGDKEYYDSVIKLLCIKLEDLYERHKESADELP